MTQCSPLTLLCLAPWHLWHQWGVTWLNETDQFCSPVQCPQMPCWGFTMQGSVEVHHLDVMAAFLWPELWLSSPNTRSLVGGTVSLLEWFLAGLSRTLAWRYVYGAELVLVCTTCKRGHTHPWRGKQNCEQYNSIHVFSTLIIFHFCVWGEEGWFGPKYTGDF